MFFRRARRGPIAVAIWLCALLGVVATLTACTSTTRRADAGSTPVGASTPVGKATGRAATHAASPTALPKTPSAARSTSPPAPPVPQPVKGNVHQAVPSRAVTTRPAVPLNSVAHFVTDISARLTSVRSISATARQPGEISGPALAISITIVNTGADKIDLGNVVVNLTDATHAPGLMIEGSPAEPFSGTLKSQRSAKATYVFTVPPSRRAPVSITVSYAASVPTVLFVGNAA